MSSHFPMQMKQHDTQENKSRRIIDITQKISQFLDDLVFFKISDKLTSNVTRKVLNQYVSADNFKNCIATIESAICGTDAISKIIIVILKKIEGENKFAEFSGIFPENILEGVREYMNKNTDTHGIIHFFPREIGEGETMSLDDLLESLKTRYRLTVNNIEKNSYGILYVWAKAYRDRKNKQLVEKNYSGLMIGVGILFFMAVDRGLVNSRIFQKKYNIARFFTSAIIAYLMTILGSLGLQKIILKT